MPRTQRPRTGLYTPDFQGHHPKDVNGTVKNFRRWRKAHLDQQRLSRKINRG